jgi:predicted PurR-regulated permease PerM
VTQTLLTLLSAVIWLVLYASVGAVVPAVIGWSALRWLERTPVVFNRTYLAMLVWLLIALGVGGTVLLLTRHGQPLDASLLELAWVRGWLVLDMLLGAFLIWRLVPRVDARRVKPTSACMTVAILMVVGIVGFMALHR